MNQSYDIPIRENEPLKIYTDGSYLPDVLGGGWCFIMVQGGRHWVYSGNMIETTNNRMELTAVSKAFDLLIFKQYKSEVTLISDSKYVIDPIEKGWLSKWIAKKSSERANMDIWEGVWSKMQHMMDSDMTGVSMQWVKGHSGNKYNEMADKIANEEAMKAGAGLVSSNGSEKKIDGRKIESINKEKSEPSKSDMMYQMNKKDGSLFIFMNERGLGLRFESRDKLEEHIKNLNKILERVNYPDY